MHPLLVLSPWGWSKCSELCVTEPERAILYSKLCCTCVKMANPGPHFSWLQVLGCLKWTTNSSTHSREDIDIQHPLSPGAGRMGQGVGAVLCNLHVGAWRAFGRALGSSVATLGRSCLLPVRNSQNSILRMLSLCL